MRGQRLHGNQWIFCNQQRRGQHRIGQLRHACARNHRRHGSPFQRGPYVVVPVEPLAAHGKKQITRRHRARVNGVAGDHPRAGIRHGGRRFEHCTRADGRLCKR